MMEVRTYENVATRGAARSRVARLEFADVSAASPTFPVMTMELRARTHVEQSSQARYVVRPHRLTGQLYLGRDSDPGNLIAYGEAVTPLPDWIPEDDQRVNLTFPLCPAAIARIAASIREPYLPLVVEVTGVGEYVSGDDAIRFQIQREPLHVQLASQVWITKVLEPIGWSRYRVFYVPFSETPPGELFRRSADELDAAHREFASGHDSSVFLHAYKALEPIYRDRDKLAETASRGDTSKKGAIDDVLRAAHRFANGGRHIARDSGSGGFPVDHVDADFVRELTTLTVAYVANRLHGSAS